ncbi:MAG: TolC family protein, partial [Flammeovirgaceae bacterium]|nr:TolC family protein [Flammeovirgaceae bacterium]
YERKPQWMIGLDYGYVDLSMWLSDHASSADMRFLMPMLGISLPIYSKKKNDAKLKELTWKIDALEKETQQIKQQLTVELANADWKKQDAKRKIELYDFQWQQTEKLIALALVEYATGKQSFSDVWQLYLMQNNYQLQKINAIFDYRMATVELEKIHGGH